MKDTAKDKPSSHGLLYTKIATGDSRNPQKRTKIVTFAKFIVVSHFSCSRQSLQQSIDFLNFKV
ncbi:MAG: hypothetical protein ACK56I_28000, partial [bacterium]